MIKYLLIILLSINASSTIFEDASNYYKKNNFKKAFSLYEQLAYNGNIDAQYNLGIFFYNGIGVKQNKVLAFIWLSTAASKNHKLAQNKLGFMYEKGDIPNIKNKKKALQEYLKSAKQNYDIAQLNLAMYYNQLANNDSLKQAFFWYSKAAKNGNIAAINNLGNMYYFGQSVKHNYKKAASLYTKAAKKGDMLAQYNLSMMYFSGEYYKKDGEMAYYWLKKSSINGYKVAQLKLANFYRQGNNIVVEKDFKKALYWYFKAAQQKYPPAQYYVGYCYFYGYGIKKDLKKAAFWMNLSKENGYNNAKLFMQRKKLYY